MANAIRLVTQAHPVTQVAAWNSFTSCSLDESVIHLLWFPNWFTNPN